MKQSIFVLFLILLVFSCEKKKALILDSKAITVAQKKVGLDKFNPFKKSEVKINVKELEVGDTISVEVPGKADFDQITIAFLIGNYSQLDKKLFLDKGETKSLNSDVDIDYLGTFSKRGNLVVVGASDPVAKSLTFRVLDFQAKKIAGRSYDDLGVIFGSGDSSDKYFLAYRGAFPVGGKLIINDLTQVKTSPKTESQAPK